MDFSGEPRPTNPAAPAFPTSRDGGRQPVLTVIVGEMPGRMFRVEGDSMSIGRLPECEIQLTDAGVSRLHARLDVAGVGVDLVDAGSTNGTFVNGERINRRALSDGDKVQLGTSVVLRFNLQDALDEAFQRQQFEQMTRDPLTGCHNRLYFDEELRREIAFSRRQTTALSLVVIDVDHFKQVNDTFGHSAGDSVLKQMGRELYVALRGYDVLARYGGEEFVALLRGADIAQGRIVAERLRRAVREAHFDAIDRRITVSLGLASVSELASPTAEELFRLADNRLYRAKAGGRDQVCSSDDGPDIQTQPVDVEQARRHIAERRKLMKTTQAQSPPTLEELPPLEELQRMLLDEEAGEPGE